MKSIKKLKPTDSELEILTILWENKNATVRQVHDELSKTKEAGYTTTLKLMQIMHEKGLVDRNTDSKIHLYNPIVEKEKTQLQFVNKLIANVFAGSATTMVLQALGGNTATVDELNQIEAFINNLKNKTT